MAEKESLRRQIELLQGIINKHKTVHGNVPAPLSSAARTWRNPVQSTNSAPQVWHAGPSQSDFPHQPHQLQKPVQQKLQPQKPQHLQEQHRQQLQQLQHLQQKLDQQKLLQEKLQQQKHQQQNQPQVEKQQQHSPQQQQRPQQPEPLEQRPAHGWRKKYSLVNKPQPPAQPSGLANEPVTSTKIFTNQALQLTLPKQPDALPTAKGRGQSVWVSSAYSKTAATRRAPPAVNPGMPSLGTVLDKTQITCNEEPCKFFKKSAHDSQQQSLMEVRDHRKQGRLKEPGEVSTPCTTLTKGTKIRNSATKWTSELCRTRSESALVLSGKPQKSPTLRSQVQRGPTTVKKLTSPVVSPTNSDTASIGGNFTKVRQNPSTVVCTSPSQVSPDACVNPLKRRLVTTHTIFSPQKCATPTPAKVLKCRKTKYTWVANPLRVSRASRKSVSPKMVESIRKSPVGTIKTILPKVSPKGDMSVKSKKAPVLLKGGASSSKYKWKAPTSVASSTPLKSKFKWHAAAQGQHSGPQPLAPKPVVPQSLAKPAANFGVSKSPFSDSPHPGYKVKSRTKIIRRKSFTSSPTDKKSSPLAQDTVKSHYFLRRRTPPKIQTVKKISPKGLVQISKHKLRRLPAPKTPAVSRDGPSPPGFRSSPAPRVIKTRYKIVKRGAACGGGGSPAAAAASISPTLLWKARKLSAARWLLLHRMRQISPTGKPSPLQQQRWKSRGLRCIGGVMYRVSANKLSKHTSPPIRTSDMSSKYFTRSGRLFSSPNSPTYISPNGTSRSPTPSRYIASRAVQRSLAIIRQAKQKKKKKEYCMYYNRFGKCNRGENCPYIHDPEKVAVCTRFLRGTCKKTDGTCTFSHKVSKDKMPVCSFYLRGICSNSNCPYSHVYVSKKAEVCLEFLKGYCPLGEKCKKKHTLVCPDFAKNGSCPKGAKCKLQHRQHKRNKRPLGSIEQQDQDRRTAKQGRHEEGASRNVSRFSEERSVGVKASTAMSPSDAEQPGTSGLQKLPSFISLKSLSPTSPTEVRPPLRERSGDESGKPLQIKPRL